MIGPHTRLSELEPARRALAEGRYETAFTLLEDAARRPQTRGTQALYHVHLAAADALYGIEGVDSGVSMLREAADADPGIVRRPLYRALHWEFRALRGASADAVRRGVDGIDDRLDAVAAYHAASALLEAGALRRAKRAFERLDPGGLPAYLQWRRWSRLGSCCEALGVWDEAARAFAEAFSGSTGAEREAERLHLAQALLEVGRLADAAVLLADRDDTPLTVEERAWAHYLAARAELDGGNPNRALQCAAEADACGPEEALRFDLAFLQAQALGALGAHPEAAERLQRALPLATPEQRSFALHERAVALLEAERPEEAEACLDEVLLDPDYPHRGEALADVAERHLRGGALPEAEQAARRALEAGAVAAGCFALGSIAYEYFDLDEAASWLEQAVSASSPGDPTWVTSHQLLADVFAQRGPEAAERLHTHARLALRHTDRGSDWHRPLQHYVERARALLGGHDRVLN